MLTSSHVLLRVFPVLRRPGRARTLAGRARLCFAAPDSTASQALSITLPSGSVHCPAASAPLAQLSRARGLRPEKPSADRESSKGSRIWTSVGSMPILVLVWVAGASPRKAEGFFGLPARTHQLCEGCGGVGCEKRCPKGAFFRACKGGSTPPKARWADEGASPSHDTGTPEKPVVARAAKQARASHRD